MTPLGSIDPRRSVPIPPLPVSTLEPSLQPSTLPLLDDDKEVLRKNRLEFIAELFITIVTTRVDALTLIPSTSASSKTTPSRSTPVHSAETIYHFKHSKPIIQPSLSRSASNGGSSDTFASMYKPQAAKSTKSTLIGKYSRFWRMAIASLILQDGVIVKHPAGYAKDRDDDDNEGEEVFFSASKIFEFLYALLYDITAFSSRGFEMTALASKKSIFDIICSYTIAGPDEWDKLRGGSGARKREMDYLDGLDGYESKLVIYMAQVVAYFLIPSRPDPMQVLLARQGGHPDIQGIVETTPSSIPPSTANVQLYSAKMMRELEEIKYFLKCVDEGRYQPFLDDIKGQIVQLPPPLPLKKKKKKDVLPSSLSEGR